MVSCLLAVVLLVIAGPVWAGQLRQLCLSCHPVHYVERGRCSDCHRGNPASERKNIAHAGLRAGKFIRFTVNDEAYIKEGQFLIDQFACRRCHISGGRGNALAVSLDSSAARKTAGELALSIRRPVQNMPDFGLDEERVTVLVNAIISGSRGYETVGTAPVKVHFNTPGKKIADIFSTKCGSCHRILSERLGAVGTGDLAPNLSGLFSTHYPKTFRNGEAWTPRNLSLWLKNPRQIRPPARMIPVTLTDTETKELVSIIDVSAKLNK